MPHLSERLSKAAPPDDLAPSAYLTGLGGEDLQEIASIVLPTGSIVACDPFTGVDATPYERKVSPGTYPVLGMMLKEAPGRPAIALIQFKREVPSRWELALRPGQSLADGKQYGYQVDTGTGSFMDAAVVESLERAEGGLASFTEREIGFDYTGSASAIADAATGANLIVFQSGFGDGVYSSWWGFGADGDVVCLATDFG